MIVISFVRGTLITGRAREWRIFRCLFPSYHSCTGHQHRMLVVHREDKSFPASHHDINNLCFELLHGRVSQQPCFWFTFHWASSYSRETFSSRKCLIRDALSDEMPTDIFIVEVMAPSEFMNFYALLISNSLSCMQPAADLLSVHNL